MNASDELPPLKARSITLAVEAVASAYVSDSLTEQWLIKNLTKEITLLP